jgi:hypothetical protein
MNWRSVSLVGFAAVAVACDIPFLKKEQAADSTAAQGSVAASQPADTTTPPPPVDTPPPPPVQVETPTRVITAPSLADEPWSPTDTGTVSPGMSRDQVVALWGQPVAERAAGSWNYLYFRNGCEVSCGTFDVVFLQSGQVVDAIVRGPGHGYAGTSSSPPGREPVATAPRSGAD